MRKWRPHFSLCVLTTTFLILLMGCATFNNLIGQTHYKTFELTLDGQKVVVNLPNGLPAMDKAINRGGERCLNAKVCRQRFCVNVKPLHDHVDFIYIGTDVIALVWIKDNERELEKRLVAWAYVEKKPISVPISRIRDLVNKHNPKQ